MKSLRKELPFTQAELAALTGTTTSAICMYEKGQRSLSAKAVIKMAELQLLLVQNTPAQKNPGGQASLKQPNAQRLKLEKMLKANISKASEDAMRLNLILDKMKERYMALQDKMTLIQLLKQEAIPQTRQMALLEVMEINALAKMEQCNKIQQLVIQYRLAICEAKKLATLNIQSELENTGII